jgi:hypothetical protein
MTVTLGPKGKYFTDVIRKRPLRARIRTECELIEGFIYIHPDKRPLDEINETKNFLAVTDAVIKSAGEEERADFIAVNINKIVLIQPLEAEGDANE